MSRTWPLSGGAGSALRALALSSLLLLAALAGCAGEDNGGPGMGDDGEGMTASEGLETAEDEAASWSEDATLYAITTLETLEDEPPEEWPEDAFGFEPDDQLADGVAPMWAYTFQNSEENQTTIFVNPDGETYQESGNTSTAQHPVESWELESSDAAEAAMENEDFANVTEAEDAQIGYFLVGGEEGASWIMNARSESTDQDVTLFVDAETGETQQFPTG